MNFHTYLLNVYNDTYKYLVAHVPNGIKLIFLIGYMIYSLVL